MSDATIATLLSTNGSKLVVRDWFIRHPSACRRVQFLQFDSLRAFLLRLIDQTICFILSSSSLI